jgi:hypothetical protein
MREKRMVADDPFDALSLRCGHDRDTVELTKFQGVTSLLPSDFHVV